MTPELSEEERELVQNFTGLPDEDRGRILALVRSLSLCRTVEVYRGSWTAPSFSCTASAAPSGPDRGMGTFPS
ncbi:MAG TPA: hypothetical protein VIH41_08715 [Myxococcales bacterium]